MATPLTHMRLPETTLQSLEWLSQANAGNTGEPGNRSAAVVEAVSRWAATLRQAATDNSLVFQAAEWCMMADALNGYFWPPPDDLLGQDQATFIAAEIEDAHRLNRLGDKWLAMGNTVYRGEVDAQVGSMAVRIAAMDQLHIWALAWVARRFWLHPDWSTDQEWWLPDVPDTASGHS